MQLHQDEATNVSAPINPLIMLPADPDGSFLGASAEIFLERCCERGNAIGWGKR